jgi:DNA helicase-2/ATP-dependent DNA helicase PcrA
MTKSVLLCPQRNALLEADGHLLVRGGPGSGKTTIALLKANWEITHLRLAPEQKVLFLSFARVTVARIIEQTRTFVDESARSELEINTYHGFAWSLIQSYGYLVTGRRQLQLLTPPDAAAHLAGMPEEEHPAELNRLLAVEGQIGFDLFAGLTAELLERSQRVGALIGDNYPLVILDEFQDTNEDEWRMVAALGRHSRLIALADPDQRIYEFRGADPARIGQFIEAFEPRIFDFGTENNRSAGTDIITFGNDLLAGTHRGRTYQHVRVVRYAYDQGEPLSSVKYAMLQAIRRLKSDNPQGGWSLAVLLSSRRFMLTVSAYLSGASDRLPPISHDVLLDPEGPALAAVVIAGLLESGAHVDEIGDRLVGDLIAHMRGRNGGAPSQNDLKLASALGEYRRSGAIRGSARQALIQNVRQIAAARLGLELIGDPVGDWLEVRRLLLSAEHEKVRLVGDDARFLRLLNRGTLLQDSLAT